MLHQTALHATHEALGATLVDFLSLIHIFLGMDELSDDDKLVVARARRIQRFLSQPFRMPLKALTVASSFT